MRQRESQLQRACVTWFRLRYPDTVIFAIPNGGNRDAITGARLKAEGVLAGVPDLFIMKASCGCHGLFIELKVEGGRVQVSQLKFAEAASRAGYGVNVIRSFDEFVGVVDTYMKDCP